ncbi:unnamed protein product [Alopecurus aequalis]
MVACRSPKSSPGFLGVRQRPSGHFTAEITTNRARWWIGTFDSAESWRFCWPRVEMNFPKETQETAEFLVPPPQLVDRSAARQGRRERMNHRSAQIDGLQMDLLHRDHPELLQAEREFYASKKTKKKRSCDEAGPSTAPPPGLSTVPSTIVV